MQQGEQDEQEVKAARASIIIPMPFHDSLLDEHVLPQAYLPRELPGQHTEVQPFHSNSEEWAGPTTSSSSSPPSPSITCTINGYNSTYNNYRRDDSSEGPPQGIDQKLADGSERRITPPPRLGSSNLNASSRSLAGIFGSPNNRTLTGTINNRSMTSLDFDPRLESGAAPSPRNPPMPTSPGRLKLEMRDV
jgi:hypothetical protein